MADNHKSPLRPEGEDLLQVNRLFYFYFILSHFLFLSIFNKTQFEIV